MRIAFTPEGWEDYTSWIDQRKVVHRVNRMIEEASHDPGFGIGKPERLSGNLAGFWSRRIDEQHRLVYTVEDSTFIIVQARYHY